MRKRDILKEEIAMLISEMSARDEWALIFVFDNSIEISNTSIDVERLLDIINLAEFFIVDQKPGGSATLWYYP